MVLEIAIGNNQTGRGLSNYTLRSGFYHLCLIPIFNATLLPITKTKQHKHIPNFRRHLLVIKLHPCGGVGPLRADALPVFSRWYGNDLRLTTQPPAPRLSRCWSCPCPAAVYTTAAGTANCPEPEPEPEQRPAAAGRDTRRSRSRDRLTQEAAHG